MFLKYCFLKLLILFTKDCKNTPGGMKAGINKDVFEQVNEYYEIRFEKTIILNFLIQRFIQIITWDEFEWSADTGALTVGGVWRWAAEIKNTT